jgi:hypothetical protein
MCFYTRVEKLLSLGGFRVCGGRINSRRMNSGHLEKACTHSRRLAKCREKEKKKPKAHRALDLLAHIVRQHNNTLLSKYLTAYGLDLFTDVAPNLSSERKLCSIFLLFGHGYYVLYPILCRGGFVRFIKIHLLFCR